MFADTSYISLGISPDADAIVLQRVAPDAGLPRSFHFAHTISIAELDSLGRADATGRIGQFTLSAMKAWYPIISMFADALIGPICGKRFAVDPPDHSGSRRKGHLRIKAVASKENYVEIRRFNDDTAAGGDTPLQLDALMALGPDGASAFLGATLLSELTALHPDVLAPFPALQPDPKSLHAHDASAGHAPLPRR